MIRVPFPLFIVMSLLSGAGIGYWILQLTGHIH